MENNFNIASVSEDCRSESHRILRLYTRFMIKKYNLGFFEDYLGLSAPRHKDYLLHITGILLKARECQFSNKQAISFGKTNCKDIDNLIKSFVFKKYI